MKNKAKRFLRLLLAIAMVMAIVPMTFALATETDNVAKIGDTEYATLQAAINAAADGQTITLLDDTNEDVTVNKAITIDGAGKTYTGKMTLKADSTIKNVNFDGKGYNGYAVETRGANYLTIEDCTAKNYGYGFVQLVSATTLTTVKNVTVSNMNYGVKIDYSTAVVLENCDITVGVAAVLNSNYGEKTITIKDSKLNIYGTWTRNDITKSNIVFKGANTIDRFITEPSLDVFKLAAGATLTAPNDVTVITDVADKRVVHENGAYKLAEKTIQVIVTVGDATKVEGNADPQFSYTTDVECPDLNISYTVNGTTINATVAEMDGYKFTVVPGTLTVKEAVAKTKINGATVYFASLQEAYDQAANNGRIDVLKDIVLTETLEMNRYRGPSIYMNGKNLSGDLDTLIHVNTQGSTVSFSSSAKVTNTGDVFFVESGNLNIYGKCTITSENSNCIYVRGGKTIVQKAIVVANGEYPAIQGNGNYTGNVTIQGGAISAPNAAMAIYWPQNGTLTITGGTITGKTALYAKSGNIVINGGEFVATGDKVAFKHNSNGAYGTGDAVVIESCKDAAYETPVVSITGGTFTSAKAEAVMLYACDTNADAKAIMELSGGIYSSKPNAKWCADGMGPKHYGDNQWTVGTGAISVDDVWFDSWDKAESSIKKNSTIVLHDDVVNYYGGTVAKDFKFPANGGNITLDLNGHSFTSAKSNTSAVTSVSVQYGTVLNIIGTGKFVIENNSYPFVINPKATVKMAESVTFIGTMQWNVNSGNSGDLYVDETALIGVNGVFKPEAVTRIVMDGEGNWTLSMGSLIMTGDASLGENTLTINKNCWLNLNGNNLTAKEIVGYGNLIDSTDGNGTVTAELWFDGHNNGGYLPLKDDTCYRLFSVVLDNRGVQTNSAYPNMIRAGFTVRFNKVEAYNLLIASVQNGAIKANATFSSGETDEAAFSKAQISSHLEKARDQLAADKVVTNAITGTLTLEDGSVSIFAELLSETNVVVASQTSTYTKK